VTPKLPDPLGSRHLQIETSNRALGDGSTRNIPVKKVTLTVEITGVRVCRLDTPFVVSARRVAQKQLLPSIIRVYCVKQCACNIAIGRRVGRVIITPLVRRIRGYHEISTVVHVVEVAIAVQVPELLGCRLEIVVRQYAADWITEKYGKKGVTAVRNEDLHKFGMIWFGMRFYAFYQILGQGSVLRCLPDQTADLGYNTLIAIQSSAFLMTLKRKNIIDWPAHAAGYTLALVLSSFYIFWSLGAIYFVYASVIFIGRVPLRMSKYTLWGAYVIGAHTVLYK